MSFIDLVMKRDGERLAATGQELPADFDVDAFLVDLFETELRKDSQDVLPGEGLKLWHGRVALAGRWRAPRDLPPDQAPQDPRPWSRVLLSRAASGRAEGWMAAFDKMARDAFEAGLYDNVKIPEGGSDEEAPCRGSRRVPETLRRRGSNPRGST